MILNVLYRISDGSYKKNRLPHATKEYCLQNFVHNFLSDNVSDIRFMILMDKCSKETEDMVYRVLESNNPKWRETSKWNTAKIQGGSSAQSFNIALRIAFDLPKGYCYFVEDDYLHLNGSYGILMEGLTRAHYISLYDHLDKYIDANKGGNPFVEDGGEITRVFKTKSCHWKLTNSTTMTFATSLETLREDTPIWQKYTEGTYPRDFDAFIELRNIGKTVATPIPAYSTHTEIEWLSPFIDWSKI